MQFIRLLRIDRERRAAALRVDRDPPFPVELKAVAAWNMVEPAMSIFEIGRLEPKR
jgi:hypothetical protein